MPTEATAEGLAENFIGMGDGLVVNGRFEERFVVGVVFRIAEDDRFEIILRRHLGDRNTC